MSNADESSSHRLFAAIVLMGTGLTLGCGGVAERSGTGSTSSGGSSTGSTSSGGSNVAGGATLTIGGGPTLVPPDPPVPVVPGPFECPPQRWNCAELACGLVANGWALPDACECDPLRPEKASDCAAGKVFVCRSGTSTADGTPFTEQVPFDCHCVDKAMHLCQNECQSAYGLNGSSCVEEQDHSALCGCAVVYLR
jgi:hypothetical protein